MHFVPTTFAQCSMETDEQIKQHFVPTTFTRCFTETDERVKLTINRLTADSFNKSVLLTWTLDTGFGKYEKVNNKKTENHSNAQQVHHHYDCQLAWTKYIYDFRRHQYCKHAAKPIRPTYNLTISDERLQKMWKNNSAQKTEIYCKKACRDLSTKQDERRTSGRRVADELPAANMTISEHWLNLVMNQRLLEPVKTARE